MRWGEKRKKGKGGGEGNTFGFLQHTIHGSRAPAAAHGDVELVMVISLHVGHFSPVILSGLGRRCVCAKNEWIVDASVESG